MKKNELVKISLLVVYNRCETFFAQPMVIDTKVMGIRADPK